MKHNGKDYINVDKVALRLRLDYNYLGTFLDVFALAKSLNMVLIKYSSLSVQVRKKVLESAGTDDGITIILCQNGQYSFRTFYNDYLSPARIRFTIAHEIKHVVFLETNPTEKDEDLADHFARYLLAPTCLVMQYIDMDLAKVISDFDISFDAAENALRCAKNRLLHKGKALNDYEVEFVERFLSNL